jgi:AraC-like DNA-binding protein
MNDFPAVPLPQGRPYDGIRGLYLSYEPTLLAAIRRGDRGEARRIINHLLVHIYAVEEERSDLLKGLLLELVVTISRAAIESGASPTDVLGINFRLLTELAAVEDDEQLAAWLRRSLEHLIGSIERQARVTPQERAVERALQFVRANLQRDITREEAARRAGVSPSHLSHLLRERTGRSFTDLLREARLDQACALLEDPEITLADIAGRCGFCDQSYFTRVFRAGKGMTPGQFRRRAQKAR